MSRRSNYTVKRRTEEAEAPKRDFPLIRKNIMENSSSEEFEEARREWEFTAILQEDEPEFVDHCEICNSANLEANYKIMNQVSRKSFLVGSSCIKRFIILGGAQSQEESNAIFEHQKKKHEGAKALQYLLSKVLDTPTINELRKFRNISFFILGSKDNRLISAFAWDEYLALLFGPNASKETKLAQRISQALFDHKNVRVKKIDRSTGQKEGSWANKTRSKTRANTSLSNSGAYQVGKDGQ